MIVGCSAIGATAWYYLKDSFGYLQLVPICLVPRQFAVNQNDIKNQISDPRKMINPKLLFFCIFLTFMWLLGTSFVLSGFGNDFLPKIRKATRHLSAPSCNTWLGIWSTRYFLLLAIRAQIMCRLVGLTLLFTISTVVPKLLLMTRLITMAILRSGSYSSHHRACHGGAINANTKIQKVQVKITMRYRRYSLRSSASEVFPNCSCFCT
jgi:hypothetical protein